MFSLNQNAEQFLTEETKSIVTSSSNWIVWATACDEADHYAGLIVRTEASVQRRKELIEAYNESLQSYIRNLD